MTLEEAIKSRGGEQQRLACSAAFELAALYEVRPSDVRALADQLSVHINKCQLGLFGYGTSHTPGDKNLHADAGLSQALLHTLQSSGRTSLPCREAWRIAEQTGSSRLETGQAADSLGIRITDCQLVCF